MDEGNVCCKLGQPVFHNAAKISVFDFRSELIAAFKAQVYDRYSNGAKTFKNYFTVIVCSPSSELLAAELVAMVSTMNSDKIRSNISTSNRYKFECHGAYVSAGDRSAADCPVSIE